MALDLSTRNTALNIVSNDIQNGPNQMKACKCTLGVVLDFPAAFDTVNHNLLLRDIIEAPMGNSTKRWVASYLQGRFSYVEYNNKKPKWREVKQCVP